MQQQGVQQQEDVPADRLDCGMMGARWRGQLILRSLHTRNVQAGVSSWLCSPGVVIAAKLPAHGGAFEVTHLDEISADQAGASSKVNG